MVPVARAWAPKAEAAPRTLLVSWIASPAYVPNRCWLRPSMCPVSGKRRRAAELRVKTVVKATAISSSFAFRTGAIAAMALPPQMAVPNEMRVDVVVPVRNILPRP